MKKVVLESGYYNLARRIPATGCNKEVPSDHYPGRLDQHFINFRLHLLGMVEDMYDTKDGRRMLLAAIILPSRPRTHTGDAIHTSRPDALRA